MAAKGRKNRHRKLNLTKIKRLQLSDLPDDVLICIISLLPTRESIATSILSKRWLNLWTSITKLEFCDHDYYGLNGKITQFINFVDRVMILRDRSDLESFSLSCDHSPRISNWITSAVQCNIKQLYLHLSNVLWPKDILPSGLFSCESLVKLELKMWFNIIVPSSVSLPNLKYLKLKCINFDSNESTKKLLSHPLLEELDIDWCHWVLTKSLTVKVPKLRVLKLQNIWGGDELPDVVDRKVGFSGDNLEYFRIKKLLVCGFYICGSAMKLKEAKILEDHVNPYVENVQPCYYNLLSGLSWVRNLTLTEGFMQILERTPELVDRIPVFKCVTKLNLNGSRVRVDSLIIIKIYEKCPHLEHLILCR